MRLLSIASGSSGNCIYAGNNDTHILIDAGISNKRIEAALNSHDISAFDLNAICITHEHADHIRSLGVLARRYGIPIYATEGTADYIVHEPSLGFFPHDLLRKIQAGNAFTVGELTVAPFSVYHDANEPVGYVLSDGKKKAAVATDMGHYDEYIVEQLSGLSAVLIESNHDVRMLEAGSYPYYLKRRILGDKGHLSNENCGKLLSRILNDHMEHVFLGHLSKENNYPDLAFEAVKCEITGSCCGYRPEDFDIRVASRDVPSAMVEL